jgi:hypothetical protein
VIVEAMNTISNMPSNPPNAKFKLKIWENEKRWEKNKKWYYVSRVNSQLNKDSKFKKAIKIQFVSGQWKLLCSKLKNPCVNSLLQIPLPKLFECRFFNENFILSIYEFDLSKDRNCPNLQNCLLNWCTSNLP